MKLLLFAGPLQIVLGIASLVGPIPRSETQGIKARGINIIVLSLLLCFCCLWTYSPSNRRWKSAQAFMSRLVAFFSAGWKENAMRAGLHAISASSYEGLHVGLCYPVPDHVACIEVSTFAHRMAGRIVVQEFNCRISDSRWVLEGNQRPAPLIQEFGDVPVRESR